MLTKDPSLSIKVERSQSMCNQQTASRQLPAPSAFSVFLTKVEPGKRSKTAKVPRDRAAFMDLSKYQKDRKSTQDKLMCKQLMHLNWTKNIAVPRAKPSDTTKISNKNGNFQDFSQNYIFVGSAVQLCTLP